MINKVAVTPANLTDAKGFKNIMPSSGATYADKGYIFSLSYFCFLSSSRSSQRLAFEIKGVLKDRF